MRTKNDKKNDSDKQNTYKSLAGIYRHTQTYTLEAVIGRGQPQQTGHTRAIIWIIILSRERRKKKTQSKSQQNFRCRDSISRCITRQPYNYFVHIKIKRSARTLTHTHTCYIHQHHHILVRRKIHDSICMRSCQNRCPENEKKKIEKKTQRNKI